MQEYDFTLKFSLKTLSTDPSAYLDSLYESGCDDAFIGIGKAGYISLNFTRESSCAFEALSSAIKNVKEAIPEAVLIEATPDLVGLTDIAQVINCSRQNVRKIMTGSDERIPMPMHEGNPSLWHLASVLEWMKQADCYAVDENVLSIAKLNMTLNATRSLHQIDESLQKEAESLVAIAS